MIKAVFLSLLHDFISVLICASHKYASLSSSINIVCLNKPASAWEMSSIIFFVFVSVPFFIHPLPFPSSLHTPTLTPYRHTADLTTPPSLHNLFTTS